MNGDTLSYDVVVADLDPGVLAAKGIVLGGIANHGVGVDAIARADARVRVDDRVGADDGASADAHPIFDDSKGPYADVVGQLGATGDNGGGMALKFAHAGISAAAPVAQGIR